MQPPSKTIPEARDKLQSQLLAWLVGLVLFALCLPCLIIMLHPYNAGRSCLEAFGVSLTFGILVWALRAATPTAAFCGSMVCLVLTVSTQRSRWLLQSALTPLILLFVLTFLATRLGKRRRQDLTGIREARKGRTASQVIANLGVAALVVPGGLFNWYDPSSPRVGGLISASVYILRVLILAALAEATADTVSSELGQAFGGTPYLLTTFQRAPAGTDGAVSLLGTLAGVAGAALVTAAGVWAMHLNLRSGLAAFAGGVAGLIFDSLLGATVERRGWLNNDLVNFSSTAFAALTTLLLLAI